MIGTKPLHASPCARPLGAVLAAAVLLAGAMAAHAQDFGRLFFTVEERLLMNQMREEGIAPGPKPDRTVREETAEAPAVGEVTFNGRVQRSDGETTIWVNGRPVLPGNSTPEGIRVKATGRTGGETRFELPSGAGFELKVGQKIKVVTGKVLESYEEEPPEEAAAGFSVLPPAAGSATLPGAGEAAPLAPALDAPAPAPQTARGAAAAAVPAPGVARP